MDENISNTISDNSQSSHPVAKRPFLKKGTLFLTGLIVLFLSVSFVFLFFLGSKKSNITQTTQKASKTWQILFTYNVQKDSFLLKKLSLLNKKIDPDYRSAKFSQFEMSIVNTDGDILYKTKIPVSTELIFNVLADPGGLPSAGVEPLQTIENVLYAPYFATGKRITISRSDKIILDIVLSENVSNSSLNLSIPQAFAAVCSPLTVVFVSDGYSDFEQYHQDVLKFEQTFATTEPYASKNPTIFDFKTIDNSMSIGCATLGLRFCMSQKQPLMAQIATSQYPNASKVVVIANAPFKNTRDGGVVGISSGIGGDFAAFPNNFGNISGTTLTVAKHELLGHAVGLLYDRYVSADPAYGLLQRRIKSNCTNNPQGETFWANLGITQTVLGCGNKALYGSTPLTCISTNPNLISGGDRISIMSAAGCGGQVFDAVEQEWIKTQILPDYTGCAGQTMPPPTSAVINTPTPTSTPTPVATNPSLHMIFGKVYNDANNNQIQDAGEQGIAAVGISLGGAATASTTTDSLGNYSFTDLATGDYMVTLNYSGASSTVPVSINNNISNIRIDFRILNNSTSPSIIPDSPTSTPTSTPTLTPTPASGAIGTGPDGSGGEGGTGMPPERTYTCSVCTSAKQSSSSLNIGQLCCTPN